jgi:hypothetical protein
MTTSSTNWGLLHILANGVTKSAARKSICWAFGLSRAYVATDRRGGLDAAGTSYASGSPR